MVFKKKVESTNTTNNTGRRTTQTPKSKIGHRFCNFLSTNLMKIVVFILIMLFLVSKANSLKEENEKLRKENEELKSLLALSEQKNLKFQSDVDHVHNFYNSCLEKSKKTEIMLFKLRYSYYILKEKHEQILKKIKEKLYNFKLEESDCDLISFIQRTYQKVKKIVLN